MSRFIPLLLSTLIITACGGGGGGGSDNSGSVATQKATLSTNEISLRTVKNTPLEVDLANAVTSSDGKTPTLVDVVSMSSSNACNDVEKSGGLKFKVDINDVTSCVYRYDVTDSTGDVEESAYTQVTAVSTAASLTTFFDLIPISHAIEINTSITVSLTAPQDSEGTAMVLGTPTSTGVGSINNTNVAANTITFDAGGTEGSARITYDYTSANGEIKMGAIDIAVSSDTNNQSPVTDSWIYLTDSDANLGKTESWIPSNATTTIAESLISALYSDPDSEDNPKIVSAYVIGATVSVVSDTISVTTTATTPDTIYVTYVVSDDNGGYASNIIRLRVGLGSFWSNINTRVNGELITFSAPLSYAQAIKALYDPAAIGKDTEAAAPNGNGEDIAMFTFADAKNYCRAIGGSLANLEQLNALYDHGIFSIDPTTNNDLNWPFKQNYWAIDSLVEHQGEQFNLNDGQSESVADVDTTNSDAKAYVTCTNENKPDYELVLDFSQIELDGNFIFSGESHEFEVLASDLDGTNVRKYTDELEWEITTPDDISTYPAVDFVHVQLDPVTGKLTTKGGLEDPSIGYAKITATTTDIYEVSTSAIVLITNNLINVGGSSGVRGDLYHFVHTISASCDLTSDFGGNSVLVGDGPDELASDGLMFDNSASYNSSLAGPVDPIFTLQFNLVKGCKRDLTTLLQDSDITDGQTYYYHWVAMKVWSSDITHAAANKRLGYMSLGTLIDSPGGSVSFPIYEAGSYDFSVWVNWDRSAVKDGDIAIAYSIYDKFETRIVDSVRLQRSDGTLSSGVTSEDKGNGWFKLTNTFTITEAQLGRNFTVSIDFDYIKTLGSSQVGAGFEFDNLYLYPAGYVPKSEPDNF